MAYFSNKSMNLLNVHYCMRAFGYEMANVFTLSYLYKQGMPLALVCAVYSLFFLSRFVLRPLAIRICLKKGIHFGLMIGATLFAIRYMTLIPIEGINFWVFVFLVFSGLTEAFYWPAYHTYFALIGTQSDRGSNVGLREALTTAIAVFGPISGGFLLQINRPLAFIVPSLMILMSIYPLSKTPEVPLQKKLSRSEQKQVDKKGARFFLADALFTQPLSIWPLIVFIILSENYGNFGLILGLAAAFRALGNLVFGKMIDKGKGFTLCLIGYLLHMIVTCARGLFAYTVPVIIACDFFSAVAYAFSMAAFMSVMYNSVKQTKHPLYFMYHSEIAWDIGGSFVMLLAGGLVYLGIDLRWILSVSIFGALYEIFLLHQNKKSGQSS